MNPIRRFALLSTVPTVTTEQLAALAAAAEPELVKVAEAWSAVDPSIVASTVRAVAAASELTDDDTPILFVAALPAEDAADAAFHYLAVDSKGVERAYALVLAEPGMPWWYISLGADHEMKEALVDPGCDGYDGPNAREIVDPVQGRRVVRGGVVLSAWVTPRWAAYDVGPPGCVVADDGPDLAPGGRDPDGYVMHQDGTQDPPGYHPPAAKDHTHSRAAKRRRMRCAPKVAPVDAGRDAP